MRVVAWNGRRRGPAGVAMFLAAYQPDIAVVRGWGDHPLLAPPGCNLLGVGQPDRGGVVVLGCRGHRLSPAEVPGAPSATVAAVEVTGPQPIRLVAVRACMDPDPGEHPLIAAAATWSSWLTGPGAPLVVAGDLNTAGRWDEAAPAADHEAVTRTLARLGLVSAFHHARGQRDADGGRSFIRLQGRRDPPHHVDHVYAAPSAVRRVTARGWGEGNQGLSDQAPLVVDLDPGRPVPGSPGCDLPEGGFPCRAGSGHGRRAPAT